jgi:hypothetical protein
VRTLLLLEVLLLAWADTVAFADVTCPNPIPTPPPNPPPYYTPLDLYGRWRAIPQCLNLWPFDGQENNCIDSVNAAQRRSLKWLSGTRPSG